MNTRRTCLTVALAAIFTCLTAWADWVPGDAYKMHYPQLPDPNGWDIKVDENNYVADDFQCTSTGPITDIHFWGSWKGDLVGLLENIQFVIWADVPDPDGPGPEYSHPDESLELWRYQTVEYDSSLIQVNGPLNGDQGWYDPLEPLVIRPDHSQFFQYNVKIDPSNQFFQQQGTVYWLEIHVISDPDPNIQFGWKTSLDHWNDDAAYYDELLPQGSRWLELRDPFNPQTGESLDMAFVIVPEPAEVAILLGLVAALCVAVRRKR